MKMEKTFHRVMSLPKRSQEKIRQTVEQLIVWELENMSEAERLQSIQKDDPKMDNEDYDIVSMGFVALLYIIMFK